MLLRFAAVLCLLALVTMPAPLQARGLLDRSTLAVPLRDPAGSSLPPGLAFPVSPGSPAAQLRSFPLQTIAEIDPELYQQISFGDTDHDGRNEAFLYVNDNGTFHVRILEEQGGNVYTVEYQGASLIPYATGDLDGDGLAEVIGQVGYKVYVYESLTPDAYPTRLAWESPNISNVVGYTAIGDTDRDGRREIIHSLNPFSGNSELFIFENAGNDAYVQVYRTVVGPGANGEKVIADLDGDGRIEIAFCGLEGGVHVYESSADNVWGRTWTTPTDLVNAYGAEGGIDTDGNGRAELFIMGNGPAGWTTILYEPTGDNSFASVQELAMDDGYIGLSCNALGSLDAIGAPEYLMQGNAHFWVFSREAGAGPWALVETVNDPLGGVHFGLQTHDVNQNGKDEVFWDIETYIQYGWKALVMEHVLDPAGLADPGPVSAGARSLLVAPNPIRGRALLRLGAAAGAAGRLRGVADGTLWLSVHDAAGRCVDRAAFAGPEVSWEAEGVAPGSYFFRVQDAHGETLAGRAATVLR